MIKNLACADSLRKNKIRILISMLLGVLFIIDIPYLSAAPDYSGDIRVEQLQRIKACKSILKEVDKQTLDETIDQVAQSEYPEDGLQILEAVAKTYADLVQEMGVVKQSSKEELYSLIKITMAYMQFGGQSGGGSYRAPLYRMIQRRLKANLPPSIFENSDLFFEFKGN